MRLKGLYNEAGYFTSKNNFKDASAANWAKNYLAYAKNTPSIGWTGYPDGRFGVNDKMNAQAFYKVLLETLGYKQNLDFTYADTLAFAEKIGLVDRAADIAAIKSFTINDIAKGIFRALNTMVADSDKKLVDMLLDKGVFSEKAVAASGLNSSVQINVMVDAKYGVAWVPIKDTFERLGCSVLTESKRGMYFEIRKDLVMAKITENVTSAYVNSTKINLEKPIIKNESGTYYVPVSFMLAAAKAFGYEAEYMKAVKVLELRELPSVKATDKDLVILKGAKKSIVVERTYTGLKEVVTKQCTFAVANSSSIISVTAAGEVTGKVLGAAEIIVSYGGKEVDRVTAYVVDIVPKYYPVSNYEQVFDTTFRTDKPNYTDAYGAVWNKMTGVVAKINEDESMDTKSSLDILNYSEDGSGITVDLSKLLENRSIKGKTCIIKMSAKGVTEKPTLYIKASSKSKYELVNKDNTISLDNIWKGYELLKLNIPADATEFTLSIATGKNQQIRIDAFTLIAQ